MKGWKNLRCYGVHDFLSDNTYKKTLKDPERAEGKRGGGYGACNP